MPSVVFPSSLAPVHGKYALRLAPLAGIHLAAFAVLLWSEVDGDARAAFVFTWGFLNFLWLTLDAPYLPLVVLEGAGIPLDPTFAEQKKILNRCHGLFYLCAGGAEARRFNRLLIDAGLIQGL